MSLGAPVRLRCEYHVNPVGIDVARPRLSWEIQDDSRGARQSAWQVQVAGSPAALKKDRADVWDSGKVKSDRSTHVAYGGPACASRQRCWWRVRTWDARGKASPWSAPASWEMGLLAREDWSAKWIGSPLLGGRYTTIPCPYVRKAFSLGRKVASARLYATALGLYEFEINGARVGDDVFTPGWTDYRKRVQYQVYDVTRLLRAGENAIGALLGDGWYCGSVEWRGRQRWGDQSKLFAQLEIAYADGSTDTIATDGSWRTSVGPLLESDMLMGESYDARLELGAWSSPGFDESAWQGVKVFGDPGIPLVAVRGTTVKKVMELKAKEVKEIGGWPRSHFILDMKQNMVGRVRLKVKGKRGTTVRLRFGEMLDKNGKLYIENLRGAKCTDYYTLRGDENGEVWEPRFTFHGFRYVEVSDYPGKPSADAVTGIVLHSDTKPTGTFECSEPLLNQLQHNIQWGQRGNFLEVPTDCPQRDERLGWTGDAQVFIRTAAFNMDVASFFTKWQVDIADSQGKGGQIPPVVPNTDLEINEGDGGPAWADAAVICPWYVYLCYGDTRLLEEHFEVFKRFIGSFEPKTKDYIREHPDKSSWGGFGDWLALDGSGKTDGGTPKDLIGTAFFAYSARLVAKMAKALKREQDAAHYERLFEKVRKAFQRRYVSPNGMIASGTQTSYVLALQFDLAPDHLRAFMVNELARDVEKRGNKLTTGFVGASHLPWVLSENGRIDVAYKLLFQKQWPSWLYAVTQGATTIWERWDGWTHDKGFQDAGMNSFNHYAYGAIGAWMYAVVAGLDLDPQQPAYKHMVVRPRIGGGLTRARARLHTMYGPAESGWKIQKGRLALSVTVPPNATATVHVPAASAKDVKEGRSPAARAAGVKARGQRNGCALFEVGAGTYRFEAPWREPEKKKT
ncbi:MAG: glycoside hydrolase family 78 protein [Planctomycetota bacterium]|nr:glycoside hydrolase family 78 protein [Planctomycetota bacterium]